MSDQITSSLISRISNRCGFFSFMAQILVGIGAVIDIALVSFEPMLIYVIGVYCISTIAGLLALAAIVCGIIALVNMTPAEKQEKLFSRSSQRSTKNMAVAGIVLPLVVPFFGLMILLVFGSQFSFESEPDYESASSDYSSSDYSITDTEKAEKQPSITPAMVVKQLFWAMEMGDARAFIIIHKENEQIRQLKERLESGGEDAGREWAAEAGKTMQITEVEIVEENIYGDNAEVTVKLTNTETGDVCAVTYKLVKENNFWYITE